MPHPPSPGDEIREHPHRHGFVMAGDKALFLCHMPMHLPTAHGHHVHLYQIAIRATLPAEDMETYRSAYGKGETVFLVNAEDDTFTLPDLIRGKKPSFAAVVYPKANVQPGKRMPPWDGLTPLIARTTVTVQRIVFWRHFDLNFDPPDTPTYILFGEGGEAFLQHYNTRSPDVDHVVQLKKMPDGEEGAEAALLAWLPEELLELSLQVNFPDLKRDPCHNPLAPGSTHRVEYCGITSFDGSTSLPKFEVLVDRTLWFNTSIINSTGKDPCVGGSRP